MDDPLWKAIRFEATRPRLHKLVMLISEIGERCSDWSSRKTSCLWPAEYSKDEVESAWRFVIKCKTWDESSGKIREFPVSPYLKRIVKRWFKSKATGQTLIIEKSRRLVVSWLLCALDVWDGGRRRCNIVQGGRDYNKASDFVWRCWFIYTELSKDNPSWKLPVVDKWGNEKGMRLDKLAFSNQTIIEPLNSNGESFRGSGYTRVKLEELSSYMYIETVLGQAAAVTMGPAGEIGGHVVAVCNASYKKEWHKLKKASDGLKRLPVDRDNPIDVYESGIGTIMRIHFSADSKKDEDWETVTRKQYPGLTWDLELEMKDEAAPNALWKAEWFEREDFRKPSAFGEEHNEFPVIDSEWGLGRRPYGGRKFVRMPDNLIKIVVAIDPSVSDPEAKKNPNKPPDECGIIVAGVDEDQIGHVLGDFTAIMHPSDWVALAVWLYSICRANCIVAEKNQGGELIRMAIEAAAGKSTIPIELVHAFIGKRLRAEPIAMLYEKGRIKHYGEMDALESECLTWNPFVAGKSPGRIDALGHCLVALGLGDLQDFEITDRFTEGSNEPPLRTSQPSWGNGDFVEGWEPLDDPANRFPMVDLE